MKPYTYKITHIETGRYYIGYKESGYKQTGRVKHIIGDNYYTSSEDPFITESYNQHSTDRWVTEILNEYETGLEAFNAEQAMIEAVYKSDPLCINKHLSARADFEDEEYIEQKRQTAIRVSNTPEERAARTQKNIERYKDPEERKKTSEAGLKSYAENPQRAVTQSINMKKRYEDPAERKKTSDASKVSNADPVVKQKISDGVAAYHANMTPEQKAARAAKIVATRARNKAAKQLAQNIAGLKEYMKNNPQ